MTCAITLVNVVGSGDLRRELDLDSLYQLFDQVGRITDLSQAHHRIILSFENNEGTISIFRTGKYNIMGSSSCRELEKTNEQLVKFLTDSDVIVSPNLVSFSSTNYVYTVEFEREINLNSLDVHLGTESEYEPEQYPFLIYKPSTIDCTMTLSSSGKCVVNSPTGRKAVEKTLDSLKIYLEE